MLDRADTRMRAFTGQDQLFVRLFKHVVLFGDFKKLGNLLFQLLFVLGCRNKFILQLRGLPFGKVQTQLDVSREPIAKNAGASTCRSFGDNAVRVPSANDSAVEA